MISPHRISTADEASMSRDPESVSRTNEINTNNGNNSPSILGPGFMFRLAVMADTDAVTLGFMGWASVSMATTIWPVRRLTLWKGTTGAQRTLLGVPVVGAWWWGW